MIRKVISIQVVLVNLLLADANSLLIEKLETTSPLVLAQKALITAKSQNQYIYTNYKNPKLSLGVNDVTLSKNKIIKRDSEAMQTQYLSISQEIQNSDKIEVKNKIALLEIYKENLVLENMEFDLLKQLRQINLKIKYFHKILEKIDKKIDNLETLKNYYTNANSLKETINLITKLREKIYLIKEKKNEILSKIKELKNAYTYILGEDYLLFEDNVASVAKDSFNDTPLYEMLSADIKIKENQTRLSQLEKIPDMTWSVAYNYREDYSDYLNVGVGFALPIYGTEDKKVIKNKSLLQKSRYLLKEYLQKSKMRYENTEDEIFYLEDNLKELKKLVSSYDSKISYTTDNIAKSSNIVEVIEDKNTRLNLLVKKIQLKSKIEFLYLEQIYLTKASLL